MKTVRPTDRHGPSEEHDLSLGGGADGRARPGHGDGPLEAASGSAAGYPRTSASSARSYIEGTEYGDLFDEDPIIVVDRRFVARRESVVRDQLRQRSKRQVLVGVAVVVVAACALVMKSGLFSVRAVDVGGASHTDADQIRRVVDVASAPAMWSVDTDAIAQRVRLLPWVASATVIRHLPSRLEVRVVEYEAVGVVVAGKTRVLVASNGRLLEQVTGPVVGLLPIQISGPLPALGQTISESPAAEIPKLLPASLRALVRSIDARRPSSVVVRESAVEIRVGRLVDLERKLVAAAAVLNQPDSCRRYVDVSVSVAPVTSCETG